MKNPCLKAGSSVITEGSQEEAENEASEDSRLRDSTQISEQKDSQIKETKRRLGEAEPETKQISAEIKPKTHPGHSCTRVKYDQQRTWTKPKTHPGNSCTRAKIDQQQTQKKPKTRPGNSCAWAKIWLVFTSPSPRDS